MSQIVQQTDKRAFPGRVIFDHLMKTGGSTIQHWLEDSLGRACVSPKLSVGHRTAIQSYGGLYSIITGHLSFEDRDDLDPRYQYVTCLREPIDRALSWLYSNLEDVPTTQTHNADATRKLIERFFKTDGEECDAEIRRKISNVYVDHFSSIGAMREQADEKKLAMAKDAIDRYDLVGMYDEYEIFTKNLSELIGIPMPPNGNRVNATSRRRKVNEISPALRECLVALNQLDLRLYSDVRTHLKTMPKDAVANPKPTGGTEWVKYERRGHWIARAIGSLKAVYPAGSMPIGATVEIPAMIVNRSAEHWVGDAQNPIRASYHWLNGTGGMEIYDGIRTVLPTADITPHDAVTVNIRVMAPPERGRYILVLTLVQEGIFWFEHVGFEPSLIAIDVE